MGLTASKATIPTYNPKTGEISLPQKYAKPFKEKAPDFYKTKFKLTLIESHLVNRNWNIVTTGGSIFDEKNSRSPMQQFSEKFFKNFFTFYPHGKNLFPENQLVRRQALINVLSILRHITIKREYLMRATQDLAIRQINPSTKVVILRPEDFNAIGITFIDTMKQCSGYSRWSQEIEDAWIATFSYALCLIIPLLVQASLGVASDLLYDGSLPPRPPLKRSLSVPIWIGRGKSTRNINNKLQGRRRSIHIQSRVSPASIAVTPFAQTSS